MAEEKTTPDTDAEREGAGERAAKAAYMREYRKKNVEKYKEIDKRAATKQRAKDPKKFNELAKERTRRYRERKKSQGISDEERERLNAANRERNAKYRDKYRHTEQYKARLAANAHRRYVKDIEKSRPKGRENTRRQWEKDPGRILNRLHKRRAIIEAGEVCTGAWYVILTHFRHRCAYCRIGGVKLTMDHVVPLSRGGGHDPGNVVPACQPCNNRKYVKRINYPDLPTE